MSTHFYQKHLSWCPVYKIDGNLQHGNYSTVESGTVSPELRDKDQNTRVPHPLPNGGIYGGPQSTAPWANIPVAPTMTNLIHNNLKSANPPPGATVQYIGTDRFGNNYSAMPGVNWYNYNDKNIRGLYKIKGV